MNTRFGPPTEAQRTGLANTFRTVFYLVVDEKSMISLQLLSQMDQRLRSAATAPSRDILPFGGMNIILCGDFFQLTLAAAMSLFHAEPRTAEQLSGQAAYRAFNKSLELKSIVRQQGDEQQPF